jgi:DNA-binding beta-propeller fold protein YncE
MPGLVNALAVNSSNNRLYVGLSSDSSLRVLDGFSFGQIWARNFDGFPISIDVDETQQRAYVLTQNAMLKVLHEVTTAELQNLFIGSGPNNVRINPTNGRIYVSIPPSFVLREIDPSTWTTIVDIPVGSGAGRFDVNHLTGRTYIANSNDWTVTVIGEPPPTQLNVNNPADGQDANPGNGTSSIRRGRLGRVRVVG